MLNLRNPAGLPPEVQRAGDIWWRNYDRERLATAVRLAVKITALFPKGIPAILRADMIVLLGEIGFHLVLWEVETNDDHNLQTKNNRKGMMPDESQITNFRTRPPRRKLLFGFVVLYSFIIFSSLYILYSKLSTSAIQLASMTFSLTPTVPHMSNSSSLSMTTRTAAAVAASELMTRTL